MDRLSAKAGTLLNSGGQLSADRLDLQLDRLDNSTGTLLHTGTAALDLELTTLDNRGGLIRSNATDLRILDWTLWYVAKYYVEPERIDPHKMAVAALEGLEKGYGGTGRNNAYAGIGSFQRPFSAFLQGKGFHALTGMEGGEGSVSDHPSMVVFDPRRHVKPFANGGITFRKTAPTPVEDLEGLDLDAPETPVLDDDAGTRFAFGLMLLIDGIAARCGTSACSRLTLPRD